MRELNGQEYNIFSANFALLTLSSGKGQISTELTISAEEFDAYDLHASPVIIAFHLREFNVRSRNSSWTVESQSHTGNDCLRRVYDTFT